jgi:hypothetical protein
VFVTESSQGTHTHQSAWSTTEEHEQEQEQERELQGLVCNVNQEKEEHRPHPMSPGWQMVGVRVQELPHDSCRHEKESAVGQMMEAHACNPSYLGG